MKINVKKINAFTDKKSGGNPAGLVLLDSLDLSEKQMSYVSKVLKVSETAFVSPGLNSDYKVLFFSPEVEVDLCGHATIATFFYMASEGFIKKNKVTQETKAGALPVEIEFDRNKKVKKVMMSQAKVILKDISLDISNISNSLNISKGEIDFSLPQQIVSTGLFTLPICVNSFNILKNIRPNFEKIKKYCNKINVGSFFVFTFDTIGTNSVYHARCFAPVFGVNEDPVTGTSNGALCSYLTKNKIVKGSEFICEQGDIIGRQGRVYVNIKNDKVKVGGRAKLVEEKVLDLKDILKDIY